MEAILFSPKSRTWDTDFPEKDEKKEVIFQRFLNPHSFVNL